MTCEKAAAAKCHRCGADLDHEAEWGSTCEPVCSACLGGKPCSNCGVEMYAEFLSDRSDDLGIGCDALCALCEDGLEEERDREHYRGKPIDEVEGW